MAKNSVDDWDTTPDNNTDIAGIGILGTSPVSNFDGAFRTAMAQLKTDSVSKLALISSSANDATGALTSSGRNLIINGGFDISQRGSGFTDVSGYTLDRWFINRNGGGVGLNAGILSTLADGTHLQLRRTAGNVNTAGFGAYSAIAAEDVAGYAGKTVSLSMRAVADASWSGGNISARVEYATTADPGVNTGGVWTSIAASVFSMTVSSTYNVGSALAFAIPSNAVSLRIVISNTGFVGTASSTDSVYINYIQLERGSIATPPSRRGGSVGGEQLLCEKYYEALPRTIRPHSTLTSGTSYFPLGFKQKIRIPSITSSGSGATGGSISIANVTVSGLEFLFNISSAGGVWQGSLFINGEI